MRMIKDVLRRRPWAELSKAEQEEVGRIQKATSQEIGQAVVDNLNKNVRERHGKD